MWSTLLYTYFCFCPLKMTVESYWYSIGPGERLFVDIPPVNNSWQIPINIMTFAWLLTFYLRTPETWNYSNHHHLQPMYGRIPNYVSIVFLLSALEPMFTEGNTCLISIVDDAEQSCSILKRKNSTKIIDIHYRLRNLLIVSRTKTCNGKRRRQ